MTTGRCNAAEVSSLIFRHLVASSTAKKSPIYSLSQKIPPEVFWQFFQYGWEFFYQILFAYYSFLSTLDYEFLFNYLQL